MTPAQSKTPARGVGRGSRSVWMTYLVACGLGFVVEWFIMWTLPFFAGGIGQRWADLLDSVLVGVLLVPMVVTAVLIRHTGQEEREEHDRAAAAAAGARRVSIWGVRFAYVLGLGVIAVIVVVRQQVLDITLEPRSYGADGVSAASQQGLYCQRIARNIAQTLREPDPERRRTLARQIRADTLRWDESAKRIELALLEDEDDATPEVDPLVAFRIAEIRRSVLSQAGHRFADLVEADAEAEELRLSGLTFLGRDQWYVEAMDKAVAGIVSDLNADKQRAIFMLHLTGVLELSVLVLVGLAVIEPAVRSVSRFQNRLIRQSREYQRLALVAEKTSNAVIISDAGGRVVWANEGFTRITGYTLAEVAGQKPGAFLQFEKTDPAAVEELHNAITAKRATRVQIRNRGKHGREYWLDIDLQPLYAPDGVLTGFIAVETDISVTKEIEQQLHEAWARAEAATETKTRFLANMSHEIRTPLNGIIGFAGLLAKGADEGDVSQRAEWLGIIHGSATHLLSLLNDVLDLSKIEASRMQVELLPCRVLSVISEAVLMQQSRASEKGIYLEVKVEKDCPAIARTDPTRLRQIVMNLVSNAVKFTERGGVLVTVSRGGTEGSPKLRVQVRDTGIGMTAEQAESLFTPFVQADSSTSRKFGGTGLGLVISRELARKLGGDIGVQSSVGLGSVFTLEINASPCDEGEMTLHEPINKGAEMFIGDGLKPLDGRRMLVVDDNEVNRKLFAMTLRKAGAEVTLAEDGLAGLKAARASGGFDVIVMDMQMPVMNGQTATRTLRSEGYAGQILALTAHSSGGDREETMAAGCNEYLSKPVDLVVLVQTLARMASEGAAAVKQGPIGAHNGGRTPRLVSNSPDADVRALAAHWLGELPSVLNTMREALTAGNFGQIAELAHSVKGTSGTIGFPQFVEPAGRIEEAALDSRRDEVAAGIEEMARLLEGRADAAGMRAAA